MRFSILTLVLATTVTALSRELGDLPDCAQSCATTAFADSKCQAEIACICHNDAFTTSFDSCTQAACSEQDRDSARQVVRNLCDNDIDDSSAALTTQQIRKAQTPATNHAVAASSNSTKPITSSAPAAGSASGTSTSATNTSATTSWPGYVSSTTKPTSYTGGADTLRLGQWMGVFMLLGLFFL